MEHRKSEHPKNISLFNRIKTVHAILRNTKCWYKHKHLNNEMYKKMNKNPEIITRIFDMMDGKF